MITTIKKFIKIGQELSTQENIDYLLEDILNVTREFTNADAGSVYLKIDDKLYFNIIKNFKDKYSQLIRGRIDAMQPFYYTRLGAAIRESAKILDKQNNIKANAMSFEQLNRNINIGNKVRGW